MGKSHTSKAGDTLGTIAAQYNVPVMDLMTYNNITDRSAPIQEGMELTYDPRGIVRRLRDTLFSKKPISNGEQYWSNYDQSKFDGLGGLFLKWGYDNLKKSSNKISFNDLIDKSGKVLNPADLKNRVLLALDNITLSRPLKAAIYGNIAHETMGFKYLKLLGGGPGVGLFMQELNNDATKAYNNFTNINGFGSDDYIQDQINNIYYEMNRTQGVENPSNRRVSTRDTRANKKNGYLDALAFEDWNSEDVNRATRAFMELYERPNPNKAGLDLRMKYASEYMNYYKDGGTINIKKSHKGKFTDYCGGKVTEECIKKGKNSTSTLVRKQATFAENARRWKHEDGGSVNIHDRVKRFNKIPKAQEGTVFKSKAREKGLASIKVNEYRIPEVYTGGTYSDSSKGTTGISNAERWQLLRQGFSTDGTGDPGSSIADKFKDVDFSRLNSATLGNNYKLTTEAKHMCTSGPGTWLLEGLGYDVNQHGGWWSTPYSTETTTANFIKNDPTHWKLVYSSDSTKANDFKGMLRGDIALSFATKDDGSATSHAAMYTGTGWYSDFRQNNAWVYGNNKGRNGDKSYMVYRYVPDGVPAAQQGMALFTKTYDSLARQKLANVKVGEHIIPEVNSSVFTAEGDPAASSSSYIKEGYDQLRRDLNIGSEESETEQATESTSKTTTSDTKSSASTDDASYTYSTSRGYRNFNPLNIVKSKNAWEGKVTGKDSRFETFKDMKHGFRAGFINMSTQIKRGKNTLNSLISSWDPELKSDRSSKYVQFVSQKTGIDPNAKIDPSNKDMMTKIVAAMARYENGSDAKMSDVNAGWNLYSKKLV